MDERTPSIASEVERYLRTGDSDPYRAAWPGTSFIGRAERAHDDLSDALVAEVKRRTGSASTPTALRGLDVVAFTRRKVEPMIRGLFPRAEQEIVLDLVEGSVIFLSPENIEAVLRDESGWLSTAWDLANLYLDSIGAELLGEDAPRLLGLSQATTCFVSLAYFEEDDPFADFVVHEVAHIFHNCKRRTAGLPETRRREWLLDIDFRKREPFAYACEAYARILERASRLRDRTELAQQFGRAYGAGDERVDAAEVADIVLEACGRPNGWKAILARCAPPRRTRRSPAPTVVGGRRS